MLIEFSIGNFLSFRDIQSFQLQAAKIKSRYPGLDTDNVATLNDQLSLLKSKAIYGANGSGKSNLIRAMANMKAIVQDCLKNAEILEERVLPCRLQENAGTAPSFFQVIFSLGDHLYRYGFEATQNAITSEWLFGKPLSKGEKGSVRERYYFTREGMEVQLNELHYKEGLRMIRGEGEPPPLYRETTLFLAVVAAFNGPIAQQISRYLHENIVVISGLDDKYLQNHSLEGLKEESFREKLSRLLQAIDPSIQFVERVNRQQLGRQSSDVAVYRHIYNEEGKIVGGFPLLLQTQEAEGTKKLFGLSAFLFSALEKGHTLFIDEFDARLHPRLTRKIVELFHSEETNPHQAQLLFATHDSNLLDARLLRRDQIAFVRKDKTGASEIYSLVEFKGVRNNASFEKEYLLGRYGAVPDRLSQVDGIFNHCNLPGKTFLL